MEASISTIPEPTGITMSPDPYLAYQPPFTYSLPIQILVSGITLTLLVVLLIHLLFTTQYHYPLAPLNYCLQLASIIAMLISTCVRLGVILQHCGETADQWPYDLEYVAVKVPKVTWTQGEEGAWYFLQAVCNGLANLTHIQFLTLLYPSRIEARLIFFMLGPLAIASSVMFFLDLSNSRTVVDLGDAIRNVFSSCLLLIFSLSLCIWGFLVNRNRAWRLDGGTGVFGMGALGLAFATTASSFVSVKEEHIDWLQHLIWATVLWQTWLGWWWWVGAGMGIGEVEDIMERALRKRRRAARRAHRRGVIEGNDPTRRQNMAGRVKTGANNAVSGLTSGLAHLLPTGGSHNSNSGSGTGTAILTRRRKARVVASRDVEEGIHEQENIELGSLRVRAPANGRHATGTEDEGSGAGRQQPPSSNSETSTTSQTPSLHAPQTAGEVFAFPATWLQVYFRRLRHAHVEAARRRAIEQAERRARVPTIAGGGGGDDGWGLGAYGLHEHAESTRRIQEADRRLRSDQLLHESDNDGHEDDDNRGRDEDGPPHPIGSRHTSTRSRSRPRDMSVRHSLSRSRSPSRSRSRRDSVAVRAVDDQQKAESEKAESEWVDVSSSDDDGDRDRNRDRNRDRDRVGYHRRSRSRRRASSRASSAGAAGDGDGNGDSDRDGDGNDNGTPPSRQATTGGWSWWGPLRDWRREDRSTF